MQLSQDQVGKTDTRGKGRLQRWRQGGRRRQLRGTFPTRRTSPEAAIENARREEMERRTFVIKGTAALALGSLAVTTLLLLDENFAHDAVLGGIHPDMTLGRDSG